MQPAMCSRCGKNVAIVFITKIEGGQTKNEGLCLKCARELHIKPIDDVINKMGISDEDLDNLTGDLSSAMSSMEGLMPVEEGDDSIEDDGKTATFPFLSRLFGGSNPVMGGCSAANSMDSLARRTRLRMASGDGFACVIGAHTSSAF